MSRQVILDSEGNDITNEFFGETVIGTEEMDPPEEDILDEKIAFGNLKNATEDPKASCRETVLEKARLCICQDRQNQYGAPEDSFTSIANYWSLYLLSNKKLVEALSPSDVALMMVLLKLARTEGHTHHVDNYVDMAGYAALAAELSEKELCVPEN